MSSNVSVLQHTSFSFAYATQVLLINMEDGGGMGWGAIGSPLVNHFWNHWPEPAPHVAGVANSELLHTVMASMVGVKNVISATHNNRQRLMFGWRYTRNRSVEGSAPEDYW
jgi:hypothetical protein